jgi:hypothetical protein
MIHRPLIPMGALTGRPTEQQLRDWLDAYRRVGIDQFMIYARSGLEIEYLSAEWFAACRHIIEHAARHGMAIWIYDEFNWPSGGAGGKVLAANPGFAARKLLIYRAAPTDFATEPVAGGLAHCRIVQSTDSHAHDVLNPDAMDCFIRLTHEQYAKHFSAYFGGTIKGFFTDEPSFAYGNTGHCDQQPALTRRCAPLNMPGKMASIRSPCVFRSHWHPSSPPPGNSPATAGWTTFCAAL